MNWGVRVRRNDLTRSHLQAVRSAGFSHVEWDWSWDGRGRTPVPDEEELYTAPRLLSSLGLTLSIAGPNGISIAEKVDPLRAVSLRLWKEVCIAASEIGARWVVLELGSAGCDTDDSWIKRRRIDLARSAVRDLRHSLPSSLPLLIENQKRLRPGGKKCLLGDDAADLMHLIERCGDPGIGIMFDTGHALIDQDPLEFLTQARGAVRAVALHANDGEWDEHRALTAADLNTRPAYWKAVAEVAEDKTVVVEIDELSAAANCRNVFATQRGINGDR